MATVVNQRDVQLLATVPRMLLVASNHITVTSTTNTFNTSAAAVTPSSITVRANLSGELKGTVTWTVSPVVPVTVNGNVVTVPATSVAPGASVTLSASLTLYGQTYTSSTVISNQAETVTSGLSASAVLVSTAADGTGGNYSSATTTMFVNIGTTDNSTAWAFSWSVPAGVTASGTTTSTVTISDMTVDSASLTCTATRTGWPTQTRTFTVSKSKAGTVGPAGTKTAVIYAYKRSNALPTGASAEPGAATYSFVTNSITTATLENGWLKTIPSGTDPLYVVVATAAATTDTDAVDAGEWTDPVLLTQNGTNGLNTASVFLYARNSTPDTPPTVATTGSSTYTFSTGTIIGQPSGWTREIPSESNGSVVWVIQATASNTTATDTIANTEWSIPQILARQGAAGVNGLSAPVVTVTATNQIFVVGKNTGTASPTTTVLSAEVNNIPTPVYEWRVDNVVQSGQTTSSFTINSFTTGSRVVRVTATSGSITAFDQITIYAVREGDDSVIGTLENENQTIACDFNGTPLSGQLPVASKFVVIRGATILTSGVTYSIVSQTGMTSTISSTGVISALTITAPSASTTYRAAIGSLTLDKTLTLNKSNNGAPGASVTGDPGAVGITARIAYLVQAQNLAAPAYSTSTSGGTSFPGASWQGTVPSVNVGQIVWYSYGRYNPNFFSHEGIAANTTVWSAPVAASIFQDIRSDNWSYTSAINVTTTPVTRTTSTGVPSVTAFTDLFDRKSNLPLQTGYYIQKSTGDFFGSNVYMQGEVIAKGQTAKQEVIWVLSPGTSNFEIYTARSALLGLAQGGVNVGESNVIRAGLTGASMNASEYSTWNVGVFGIATSSPNSGVGPGGRKGVGVVASGDAVGVFISCEIPTATGLVVESFGGTNQAADFGGNVTITRALSVGNGLTVTGGITATGNITAFQSSDQRLKNNIQRIANPLEKLRGLGGYYYDWTPEYLSKYTKEIELGLVKPHDVGVIAQQVLAQIPEAVATRQDGTLAVNYEKLIPLLIEAILELDRRIH
jgi:hypothetical protein